MGTRPRYWLIRTKVGLVARVVAPSPRTTPWMKQVFPAPSSPTRATTSPGPSAAASRSPAASVCSALVVRSSVVIATEPLERLGERRDDIAGDRKSTRLNSSHGYISYAVFCLKKKNKNIKILYEIVLHLTTKEQSRPSEFVD